jgi:hypothetical protein
MERKMERDDSNPARTCGPCASTFKNRNQFTTMSHSNWICASATIQLVSKPLTQKKKKKRVCVANIPAPLRTNKKRREESRLDLKGSIGEKFHIGENKQKLRCL